MNAPEKTFLSDVQSDPDRRNLEVQRVDVRDITHPLTAATARGPQPTVSTVDVYVVLPPEVKGTHMSRCLDADAGFDAAYALIERVKP